MANRLKWAAVAIYLHRTWPSVGGGQKACIHEIPEHRRHRRTLFLSLSLSLSSPFLSFSSDRHTRVTLWGETIHIVNSIKTATSNMVAMIGTKSPGRKRQRAWLPPSVDRRLSNPLSRLNIPVYRIQLGPCYQGTNLDRQFRRRTEEWMSFDRIDRRPTTPK